MSDSASATRSGGVSARPQLAGDYLVYARDALRPAGLKGDVSLAEITTHQAAANAAFFSIWPRSSSVPNETDGGAPGVKEWPGLDEPEGLVVLGEILRYRPRPRPALRLWPLPVAGREVDEPGRWP